MRGPFSSDGGGPAGQAVASAGVSFLLSCGLLRGWVTPFWFLTQNGHSLERQGDSARSYPTVLRGEALLQRRVSLPRGRPGNGDGNGNARAGKEGSLSARRLLQVMRETFSLK